MSPFTGIGNGKYKSPSGKIFTAKQVKLYYATDGFKKKPRIHKKEKATRVVDNRMKSFGDFDETTNKIRINKKKAKKNKKGNYPELKDTIYHEELHKRNPKLTEKQVVKKTKKAIKKIGKKVSQRLYNKYN